MTAGFMVDAIRVPLMALAISLMDLCETETVGLDTILLDDIEIVTNMVV